MNTENIPTPADPIRFGRLLPAVAGIYAGQSVITAVAMQSLPILMRQYGIGLKYIGLSSLFMLPWVFKFLWSGKVERSRLPEHARPRSKPIIVSGQAATAALLLAVSWLLMPGEAAFADRLPVVWVLLFLCTLTAATTDIACDGFVIDSLMPESRGWGNVMQIGGNYVGLLAGGSFFLLICAAAGPATATAAAAVLLILMLLPLALLHIPASGTASSPAIRRPSLRAAFNRKEVWQGITLVFILSAGIRTAFGMLGPMLSDTVGNPDTVALLMGGYSIGCGLSGTVVGGFLVRKTGVRKAVAAAVFFQGAALCALAVAAGRYVPATVILTGLVFAAAACAFVAVYSLLMGMASPQQPGIDFTLFQCSDALMAVVGGVAGGFIAGYAGYGICFLAAGIAALAAGSWFITEFLQKNGNKGRKTPHEA